MGRVAQAGEAVRAALDLYRGPLLAGEDGLPAVLAARERLRDRTRTCVEQTAGALEAAGDVAAALSLYRAGVECDDECEPLYLGLLRTCLATGRYAEGLAAYRRCEQALRAGLDAAPSPAVREAYERLRAAAETPAAAEAEPPAVAVLAFDNLGGDPAQEYLGDGLADSLITALARLPELRVAARHSAFAYKGRDVDVRRIGEALGVAYVLERGVLRSGERLRLTAQLIDARTGHHVWAESYDRTAGDLLAVLDDITHRIVVEMGVSLVYGYVMRYFAQSTVSPEAFYRLVQGFWHFQRFERQTNETARRLLAEAIELDPRFARAMAVMGQTCLNHVRNDWGRDVGAALAEAEEWAQRSLEADPQCAIGLNLLAKIHSHRGQHAEALALSERMLASEPDSVNTLTNHAVTLMFAGRSTDALATAQRAGRLCPQPWPVTLVVLAEASFMLGRYQEARPFYEQLTAHAVEHSDLAGHFSRKLIAIHMHAGREAEAVALATRHRKLHPTFTLTRHRRIAQRWPQYDDAWFAPYQDLLRRAGLPD